MYTCLACQTYSYQPGPCLECHQPLTESVMDTTTLAALPAAEFTEWMGYLLDTIHEERGLPALREIAEMLAIRAAEDDQARATLNELRAIWQRLNSVCAE